MPTRLVLPLRHPDRVVVPQPIGDVQSEGLEFPTIDYESVNGRPYTFAYFVWERDPLENGYYDSIIKLDMQSGHKQT